MTRPWRRCGSSSSRKVSRSEPRRAVTLKLSPEQHQTLRLLAAERNTTMQNLILLALRPLLTTRVRAS